MNRFLSLSLLAAGLALSAATAQASTRDYHFQVLLDDAEIGHHHFDFEPAADGYRLVSEARYDVKILFFNAYQYRHRSEEQWAGGCLQAIRATTDDNGDDFAVAGQRGADGLALRVNGAEQAPVADCVRTFAYWQPELLTSPQLLNSQTGELEAVTREKLGAVPLPWSPGRSADSVQLATEDGIIQLWYGEDGTWLGLRSTLANGRVLEYRPAVAGPAEGGR